jgi:hypothetical protein
MVVYRISYVVVEEDILLKDRKWRPEGGEWEPRISFEIVGHCPKITAKHNWDAETRIPKSTSDEST